MKRCPQCLFLFPDSDEKCDFDQTPLEVIDEATIAATVTGRPKRRTLPIAAAIGLLLGVLGFAIYYYAASRPSPVVEAAPQNPTVGAPISTPVPTEPSPSPSVSPSPSPSASPNAKSSPNVSTSHTRSTLDPVSTSGPGIGARQGNKPLIVLTSGGKIDADEVWRTKDGIWYRRNGMVTLLKRNQVKTIVTR
jgi:hypothetical protein